MGSHGASAGMTLPPWGMRGNVWVFLAVRSPGCCPSRAQASGRVRTVHSAQDGRLHRESWPRGQRCQTERG